MKNARLDQAVLQVCAVLMIGWSGFVLGAPPDAANPPGAEVNQMQIERTPEGVFLSATVRFELPTSVEDALLKGVAMIFVAESEIYRARWYWYSKRVAASERHFRLAYQPLTRRWRVNVAPGAITAGSLGLALNQSYDTLPEALAAVQRISRWKIAEPGEIDSDAKHNVEFRYKLDHGQLPRPFQIGVLGQADWSIIASATQALPMQTSK